MLEKAPSTTQPKKNKKSRKKSFFIFFFIILIILLIVFFIYNYAARLFSLLNDSDVQNTVSTQESSITSTNEVADSINSNMLVEFLDKQQEYQQVLLQRIEALEQAIKTNPPSEGQSSNLLPQINKLEHQIEELNSKHSYIENIAVINSLIFALHSNAPFINELNAFKRTNLGSRFSQEVAYLSLVASKGIPNKYDMVYSLNMMFPKIKQAVFQADNSIWGQIKYYLSYLIVIQKTDNFAMTDKSVDSIVNDIKHSLLNDVPGKAQALLELNNLQQLQFLDVWYLNLQYRVAADKLASQLQQYLLNSRMEQ